MLDLGVWRSSATSVALVGILRTLKKRRSGSNTENLDQGRCNGWKALLGVETRVAGEDLRAASDQLSVATVAVAKGSV